jgi:hypothetical protein
MVRMLMRKIGLLVLLAPVAATAQSLPGNALSLGANGPAFAINDPNVARAVVGRTTEIATTLVAASRAGGRPSASALPGTPRLPDAGLDPAGPLAGDPAAQQRPLSPREQQRRVERLRIEAEEAGDADSGPDRPREGSRTGFAMRGMAEADRAGQADQEDPARLDFWLSVGNATLWAGSDWVFDEP